MQLFHCYIKKDGRPETKVKSKVKFKVMTKV